jgi:hypothetical protein
MAVAMVANPTAKTRRFFAVEEDTGFPSFPKKASKRTIYLGIVTLRRVVDEREDREFTLPVFVFKSKKIYSKQPLFSRESILERE